MSNEELKAAVLELVPATVFEEGGEWLTGVIEPQAWLNIAEQLKERPELHFDFLFCLTCIDWKAHLMMVFHLRSTSRGHILVVKSKLDRNNPEIQTVSHLWRTAEFHEREVYELFGVKFLNHPDLRRLLLTDELVGFPLRKDFDDPVNMIKL